MIMNMTAMTSAMWISPPKVGKTNKPSNQRMKRIIPIINKIPIFFPPPVSKKILDLLPLYQ
jgi:hypothetical protein